MIHNRGALVVVGGIDIPFWGRGFGSAYEKLSREKGSILIPNVVANIYGKQDLMSDPIHPNDKGYAIMANAFYKALEPYL